MAKALELAEMEKTHTKAKVSRGVKSGPRTMHFQHSGAKIRVFEQNTDIIQFGFFT